jgi:hypothetical protein
VSIGNSKFILTLHRLFIIGILVHRLVDEKPFRAFDGLKQGPLIQNTWTGMRLRPWNATEFIGTAKQKYLVYFYCSSYFGGCDLIDLYYLKERQLRKGRIVFERTKILERIDLKLHPKAIAVIDRNKVNGSEWLFPWGKIKSSMKCLGVLTSAP